MILAGCGNSAKNMTFEQTYNSFIDTHTTDAVKMLTELASAPALAEKGSYVVDGAMTSGANIHLSIGADSTIVNSGMNSKSTLGISGSMMQPGSDDVIHLDAAMFFNTVAGVSYINFDKLSLTSQKGNPEISMIGAFSSVLTKKWISLQVSGGNEAAIGSLSLSKLYALPSTIVAALKAHPIFTEQSKEMIDDAPMYHVALSQTGLYLVAKDLVNNETIKSFMRGTTLTDEDLQAWAETFVANSAFSGTLTAHKSDDVTLHIAKLMLDDMSFLTSTVEKETTSIQIYDTQAVDTTSPAATLSFGERGDTTTFSLALPEQSLALSGSIELTKNSSDKV